MPGRGSPDCADHMDLVDVTSYRAAEDRTGLALSPGERFLGGGTWLFSTPQPGVTGLVDLTGAGWPDWEELPDGGLRLAATCTVARLSEVPWPLASTAALARACADALLMSWKVQAAATVGGNVALALPAGAMTALFAGLGAAAVIWTADDERRVAVADLVTGAGTTSLAPGEVIRGFDVPASSLQEPTAMRRHSLTDLGRSASLVVGRATSTGVLVTVTAATPAPVVLVGSSVAELGAAVDRITHWHDDVHGSPAWRAAVTRLAVREIAEELC